MFRSQIGASALQHPKRTAMKEELLLFRMDQRTKFWYFCTKLVMIHILQAESLIVADFLETISSFL